MIGGRSFFGGAPATPRPTVALPEGEMHQQCEILRFKCYNDWSLQFGGRILWIGCWGFFGGAPTPPRPTVALSEGEMHQQCEVERF